MAQMKTVTKVMGLAGIAVLIASVVGAVGYAGMHTLSDRIHLLADVRFANSDDVHTFDNRAAMAARSGWALVVDQITDLNARREHLRLIDESLREFDQHLAAYDARPKAEANAKKWQAAQPVIKVWRQDFERFVAAARERQRAAESGNTNLAELDKRAFQLRMVASDSFRAADAAMDTLVDGSLEAAQNDRAESEVVAARDTWTIFTVVVIAAVVLGGIGFGIGRNVQKGVAGMVGEAARLTEAATAGQLSVRADVTSVSPEFRPVLEGMNSTLDELAAPLNMAVTYMDRIAKGDIPPKITDAYQGDFKLIKDSLNTCIETINTLVADTHLLVSSAVKGQLSTRADARKHQGDFRKIVEGMNDTLDAVVKPLSAAAHHIDRIAKGDIPAKISDSYQGEFNAIKDNLNRCIEAIGQLVHDTNALAAGAVEGRLTARADASRHEGDYRKIVDGLNRTLDALLAPINEASQVLDRLAQRDLRARMQGDYKGDHAKIKQSLNLTAEALHDALSQVASSVDQVSSAAGQIASSSQAVADGASSQASSLEQTSSSLESMSSMTRRAADSAQQANALAQTAKTAATGGATAVEQMTVSMGKIKASAEGTSQIIKDINEIAFQTNLLALNAAVEAARAGEAGRGFAVVAEEVRSLALRSKEAAMKTEELIRESVRQAGEGEVTAKEVSSKLADILAGVSKVSEIVTEISASAKEQAAGVDQVTQAVADMNKVTQQNAANSEESSSAAAELSSQAEELAAMVGSFQLSRAATVSTHVSSRPAARPVAPVMKRPVPSSHLNPEQVIPLEQDPAFRDF